MNSAKGPSRAVCQPRLASHFCAPTRNFGLLSGWFGGDTSSAINRIIREWAASRAKSNASPAATPAGRRAARWDDR
jgi:hypothetical protein